MSHIVPAVLPTSREDLEKKLALFARIPAVSRVQVDVVDGKFASPASWPYNAPNEFEVLIARGSMLPNLDRITYEIDLMCLDAEQVAGAWLALGASRLTFHAESVTSLPRLFATMRAKYGCGSLSCGLIAFGLAINVTTDIALIEPFLDDIEYVQFMGIAKIGRQGQPFDRRVLEKIRIFHHHHPKILLQVDGGVSLKTARELLALGVAHLISGSAILRAADPVAEVARFDALSNPYGV
jgi:ribulose-phosphate 3-epimerase